MPTQSGLACRIIIATGPYGASQAAVKFPLNPAPKVPFSCGMRKVAAIVCMLAVACSTSSRGGGGVATGDGGTATGDGGVATGGGASTDNPNASNSLGIQATNEFTNDSLATAEQVDVAFTFSPSRQATRLRADGVLCSGLGLDGALAYPAVVELANTDARPLVVSLYSAFSHVEALVVYDVRPETSAGLLRSCVAVAASEGESRYGFSRSSPSTFTIAPGNSLYVYAQRSEDLFGEQQSASVSVTLAK